MPITSGATILNGKYTIIKRIGMGAMGYVWLAEEVTFGNRQVAIKQPLPHLQRSTQEQLQRRFLDEVVLCAALEKARVSHVVRALTAEPYENSLLLVLEYMSGGDLGHRLQTHPDGLPVNRALAITQDLLSALSQVHAHPLGIVHRDIKPTNILFDAEDRAYLGDFGIAQIADKSYRLLPHATPHPGTPYYMAPEQAITTGYLTPAADIFALGCVLFEMLTGKIYKTNRPGTPPSKLNPSLPVWLDAVLAKALAEKPLNRYQNATEMAAALKRDIKESPKPINQKYRARNLSRRNFVITGGLAVCGLMVYLGWRVINSSKNSGSGAGLLQVLQSNSTQLALLNKATLPLVHIPAGKFTMGSSAANPGAEPDEMPQHAVILDEYLIGKTEVTVSQFRAFIEATDYAVDARALPVGRDDYPVTYVNWDDAVAFCSWASQVTGRRVRLPSEAEWEKAARGTDARTYPWGSAAPDCKLANGNACVGDTVKVGAYPDGASPYGALDMAGNVYEWVNDWYGESYYTDSPASNPSGPTSGSYRVMRGGGWDLDWDYTRVAFRNYHTPANRYGNVGFRVAVSAGT